MGVAPREGAGRAGGCARKPGAPRIRRLDEVRRPFRTNMRLPSERSVGRRARGWKTGMKVADFLDPGSIVTELRAGNKKEVLEELCQVLSALEPEFDQDRMVGILLGRERLGSTGVGEGVAIPHGKMADLGRLVGCFGRSMEGVEFEAVDGKPVHLFFLLFAPENSAGIHLRALAKISRLLKRPSLREALLSASGREEIYDVLTGEDVESAVPPQGG